MGVGPAFAELLRDMFQVQRIDQIAKADYKKVIRALESRRKFRQQGRGGAVMKTCIQAVMVGGPIGATRWSGAHWVA